MRGVVDALEAAPVGGEGYPEPMSYQELAVIVYGRPEPSRAQREAVARVCRRLASDGKAELWFVWRERWPRRAEGAAVRSLKEEERRALAMAERRHRYERARAFVKAMAATGAGTSAEFAEYLRIVSEYEEAEAAA
jgi:hypothetical protein